MIVRVLTLHKIDIKRCCGQTYDGAAVMSGIRNGVHKKILESAPHAYYTHSFSHRLNLAMVDASRASPKVGDCLDVLLSIYNYFSSSMINAEFMDQQSKLAAAESSNKVFKLKRHADTRWISRHESCEAVMRTLPAIMNTLEYFAEAFDSDRHVKATSILGMIDTLFVAHLVLITRVLKEAKLLTKHLQSEQIDYGVAIDLVNALKSTPTDLTKPVEFDKLWADIVSLCDRAEVPHASGAQA